MKLSNPTWILKSVSIFIATILVLSACVNTRSATYFNGVNDATLPSTTRIPESVIQKNDLLSVSISSLNPEATKIFNDQNTASAMITGTTPTMVSGYLVGSDGTIQFPLLGNLKAEGLTKNQLNESIVKKILEKQLLKDPVVSIRFLNFRVTVLGEVKNPAVVSVPNEKISLLEAIGLAGDLTIYAKRDNILIIREENGNTVTKRLNLNSNELLTSPYYYLKSNDVVYVEPNKAKVATSGSGQQWIPIVVSGLTLAVIVIDRIVQN
jgi:polysaccharide biosynthesis/export protein